MRLEKVINCPKMPSFKFVIFLSSLLVISLLSLGSGNEAAPTYMYHFCSGQEENFTANSPFQSNLELVLSSLSSNATLVTGFSNASAGEVKGIFLCRGDVNATVCQDCVAYGAKERLQRCNLRMGAVIWYEECLVRYSNYPIFATLNEGPATYWGDPTVPEAEKVRFNGLLGTTMRSLATQLASNSSTGKKYFATEEVEFSSSLLSLRTLYSLVQCTPDLTVSDCNKCIQGSIDQLPTCCDGKQGGWVLRPSCILRYGLNKFYNSTAASEPAAFPPPAPGKSPIPLLRIVAIVASIAVFLILFAMSYYLLRRRVRKKFNSLVDENGSEITSIESLQFDLATIKAATNQFSDDNEVGRGGFGEVYKGTFPNRQEIAVKRLSKSSGQGAEEFKNEVVLIAKLQHRNLVRLLGFCLEGEEKILVYEFVTNKSLDYFLFDPKKQGYLDWSRRYNIIVGIARGILYLHEDSRLRIIHRDLKAGNILLDENMNPKISDFGMAKIFKVDQTRGNTNRIVGTYGYMSPEYGIHGQFSMKSDVYSFGVLLLEILSGKKNDSFCTSDTVDNLLSYAWRQWRHGTSLELLDSSLRDSYSRNEVEKCIHIGLLCVQENPAERPTMASIVVMLSSYSVTLPSPQRPGFFLHSRTESNAPTNGLVADQSTSKSEPLSEASLTYPR